jgi:hypothetical protein
MTTAPCNVFPSLQVFGHLERVSCAAAAGVGAAGGPGPEESPLRYPQPGFRWIQALLQLLLRGQLTSVRKLGMYLLLRLELLLCAAPVPNSCRVMRRHSASGSPFQ